MIKAVINWNGYCVVVQRANPAVPAVTGSDNVNSVSPGVQSRDNDIYIDPI